MKSATPIRFNVIKRQNGEMYHGLVKRHVDRARDLKARYHTSQNYPTGVHKVLSPGPYRHCVHSRKQRNGYGIRSEVFGRLNTAGQDAMHDQIRSHLNEAWPTRVNDFRYATPSYAAKFWINRFLRLTVAKFPNPSKKQRVALICCTHQRCAESGDGQPTRVSQWNPDI